MMFSGGGKPRLRGFASNELRRNLDVEIGSDVWIGGNATILAGVKIGHGVVIGAGAVVTKDVPDYAIAVGIPARVQKYRHSESVIKKLLALKWWEHEPNELWALVGQNWLSSNVEEVLALFGHSSEDNSNIGARILARWPAEDIQKQYTGNCGEPLLHRTLTFCKILKEECAIEPGMRVLDFGCGFGRIAAAIHELQPEVVLRLADAWQRSIDNLDPLFKPWALLTPEKLDPTSFNERFDTIYSYSIFTHLSEDVFLQNLLCLRGTLNSQGRFYFTVRHEDFLDLYNGKGGTTSKVEPDGFYHFSYKPQTSYGETIIGKTYLRARGLDAQYLGCVDSYQHLYMLRPN
jgi:SAM-dependent methyltransferase